MARCTAIKSNGERCKVSVEHGVEFCWAHDPTNAEQRRRITSRAGRSKPRKELACVKTQLQELARSVLAGELETGRAAVVNQLINTRLRAVELERKVRETEELEARLEALERSLEATGAPSHSWG
jgi:hypothetical protein